MRAEIRLYLFQEIILVTIVILDKTNLLKIKKKEEEKQFNLNK